MKWRRSLAGLVMFLLVSGSLMGSEPVKLLQVRWSELGKRIGGKKVTLQLADGERVEGQVRKVTATALVVKVKKSSNVAAHPKGEIRIPRETVSRIEARSSRKGRIGREAGRVGLTGAAFVGTLLGSLMVVAGIGARSEEVFKAKNAAASLAIATGVALLTYRALRPKGVTLIEILPDSPGEGKPKPKNGKENQTGGS